MRNTATIQEQTLLTFVPQPDLSLLAKTRFRFSILALPNISFSANPLVSSETG